MVIATPTPADPTVEFDLRYEGPALDDNEMDVRDFAPALISTADLFQATNRLLRPADPDVAVNIRATSQGSFEVLLKLIYDNAVDVLTNPGMLAGESLVSLLGTIGGVIHFRRKRGASAIVSQTPALDPGMVRTAFADGTTLEFPVEVLMADGDGRVRKALRDMARPLNRSGIDSLTMRRGDDTVGRIEKEDLPALEFDDSEVEREILVDSTSVLLVQITAAVFQAGNKWRFSDGDHTFWASIEDSAFIELVDRGEPFAKGDMLRCAVRTLQWRDLQGSLHAEKSITQVLEHLRPASSTPTLFTTVSESTDAPEHGTGA